MRHHADEAVYKSIVIIYFQVGRYILRFIFHNPRQTLHRIVKTSESGSTHMKIILCSRETNKYHHEYGGETILKDNIYRRLRQCGGTF